MKPSNTSESIDSEGLETDEIDLARYFGILWHGKLLILSFSLVGFTASVLYALSVPNTYHSEALLAPNQTIASSDVRSTYGDLASLAGINLQSGVVDSVDLSIEILKSRRFIFEFISNHDMLVPLMAAKGWDSQTGELLIDSDIYEISTETWTRNVSPPRQSKPSLQEAFTKFTNEHLSLNENRTTGFITIAVEHYSPFTAKQWVDWLVQDINLTIMERDVAEAEQAIAYLRKQVNETSLAELQAVFFRLIEDQIRTVVLAKASPEYVLKTIDPAVISEEKSGPNRLLLVVVGLSSSFLLGVFIQLVVYRMSQKNS